MTRAENAEAQINPWGAKLINDQDYQSVVADLGVIYETLSTTRTLTLPALNSIARFRPFPIADESGNCASGRAINIAPQGGDLINGSPNPISMEAAYQIITARPGVKSWFIG